MAEPERSDNVLRRTAGGAGWTISWRVATRALGFLSTIVLARLLVPADFGLVSLAMSFATAIDVFAEIGVRGALVRAPESDKDTYDAAFTLSALRGMLTTLIVVASAGLFTRSLGDPRLYWVVLTLSSTILLNALENVGVADFQRYLNFQREFQLLIFPRLVQVAVTIALALSFRSYWALVAGILISRVLQTVASYALHPYRPRLSLKAWREIAGFSFWTWLLSMAQMIRERVSVMIMGASLSVAGLGLVGVGMEVAELPASELLGPAARASFAGFAAARRGHQSVSDVYLRIVALALVATAPVAIGVSAVAAPVVHALFGDKWLQAIPVVQILGAAGAFSALRQISWSLFNALAYLRWLFSIAVFLCIIQLALLVLSVGHWGLVGAAVAFAAVRLIEPVVLSVVTFRTFAIRPGDLLSRTWRCLVASTAMTILLVTSGLGWAGAAPNVAADIRQLLIASASGAATYATILFSLWLASGKPNGPEVDLLSILQEGSLGLIRIVKHRTALILGVTSR